jgi:signal transduction histidine kinase
VLLAADPDQLEQMLINLLRNAAEAVLETRAASEAGNGSGRSASYSGSPVVLTWELTEKDVTITVSDAGPGLMNPGNAFVPFYTTKPQGSGIGLILSRQICEAHGGSIELTTPTSGVGCVARVVLPTRGVPSCEGARIR